MFTARLLLVLLFNAGVSTASATPGSTRQPLALETEKAEDPPSFVWRTDSSERMVATHGSFTSYQVNVDANGANIIGDAANEPSIAVNPNNLNIMSIGWRQFNSVGSNFRQGGYAYSFQGGTSWTFPGVLDGSFRSDPVLLSDAAGNFRYLSLVPNFYCDLWNSDSGGQWWFSVGPAVGGDKQWFAIDNTNSTGRGFQYQVWSTSGNNYGGRQFSRSLDGGSNWMDPIHIPNGPSWGTLDVNSNGDLFIGGVGLNTGWFWCVRSTDAKNPNVTPSFDQSTRVDLGGWLAPSSPINPQGLSGQVSLAVDRSGTSTHHNVYMLASLEPYGATNGTDVMFARSTDGGQTFSSPRRINDDAIDPNKWHWFGTLAVAPNGRIDVVWLDTRNAANHTDSQLFYSYSTDGGNSWSLNVPVSDLFDPFLGYPNQAKMGDYMTMVSDNEGGHVAYCATLNGEQDVYYVRVTPAAATASLPAFAVRSVARDANGATITFPSRTGKRYRCEYSDATPVGPWVELQTNIPGNGRDLDILDPAAVNRPKRFYRVVMLP